MRLDENPVLPLDEKRLNAALSDILRAHAQAVNAIVDGRISAFSALPAPPITGRYANGDFVPNSVIAELGAIGSKYIVEGWTALGGEPGVFLEKRSLTGN